MFDMNLGLGEIGDLLMKLHKGSVASFNAKKTTQVLALFPGWTIVPMAMIKPTDEARQFSNRISYLHPTFGQRRMFTHNVPNMETGKSTTTIQVIAWDRDEAVEFHRQIAKFVVAELPDVKKAKPDDYFVMNLTDPAEAVHHDRESWVVTFDLFRKCKGYVITSPDNQRFDVCGPVQVLGYAGTQDFSHFLKWALANTDLETAVNAKLGLSRHIPASERPRAPVGSQILGTCAICLHSQVVRNGKMVNHGYQRPGYGYIIGECFGVDYDPYEVSANACVAYIPGLRGHETKYRLYLAKLTSGKIVSLTRNVRNRRTDQTTIEVIAEGHKDFPALLAAEIHQTENQITYVVQDIAIMTKRINTWKPGTLRRNEV